MPFLNYIYLTCTARLILREREDIPVFIVDGHNISNVFSLATYDIQMMLG